MALQTLVAGHALDQSHVCHVCTSVLTMSVSSDPLTFAMTYRNLRSDMRVDQEEF